MRTYQISCYSHGMRPVPNTPLSCTASHAKAGEVAVTTFRRVFGLPANRHVWMQKGQRAAAEDRRGNRVCIEQINKSDLPGFDPKSGTFPLALIP